MNRRRGTRWQQRSKLARRRYRRKVQHRYGTEGGHWQRDAELHAHVKGEER